MKLNSLKFSNWCRILFLLIISCFLNACNGGGTAPSASPASNNKAITAYSINGESGVIINQNIAVIVSLGTNVESLVATFTTTGTSVMVNGALQISGVTANDFTNPVTYLVTAGDGSSVNYTVNVIISNNYIFQMNTNHVSSLSSSTCSQTLSDQLQHDITVDPQIITLAGFYDILRAMGHYEVVNYQNLGIFVLNPLGLDGVYYFGGWREGDVIEINGHTYPLYGILFDVPGVCKNQSQWGTCGVLSLLITDSSVENGTCALSSTPGD